MKTKLAGYVTVPEALEIETSLGFPSSGCLSTSIIRSPNSGNSSKGGVDLSTGRITYRDKDKKGKGKTIPGKGCHDCVDSINHIFDCVRNDTKPTSSIPNGRDATLAGLLIRTAVDERRTVTMEELVKKMS